MGADGNCLFSAANIALRLKGSAFDLRRRVVSRFSEDYLSGVLAKGEIDVAIRNLYRPDMELGWGVHFIQELKLLARKKDRESLDSSIDDLVRVGLTRSVICIHHLVSLFSFSRSSTKKNPNSLIFFNLLIICVN